ncbi:hypothetical protein [Jeotgalibacillus salarius]|uniref:hypothetical protein n=1 Tax=Jeotgalibacillus salarius TaxID=546023 RepID=UPI00141B5CEA|nr:hypothetical protein [Jeotgalibacillus salarius]
MNYIKEDTMFLIYYELKRLVDDYYKCTNTKIKDLILSDIQLLTDSLNEIEYD